jgi:hypothetical protein
MALELDHAFVGCTANAPEAEALLQLGLVEGSSNTHAGQGTANRRFFFDNFMLELIWVADATEATNPLTSGTRLWERCSSSDPAVNPFGILFRAVGESALPAPFRTWSYSPSYLPPGVAIEIAEGTTLQEPGLFYLPFLRGTGHLKAEPTNHALPFRRVKGLSAGVRSLAALSEGSREAQRCGVLDYFEADRNVLEIHFEGSVQLEVDLQPALPLVLRVAP